MKSSRIFSALLVGLALVIGVMLWLQRQATEQLRGEVAGLREAKADLQRAQGENQRLRSAQISEEELARLRADHAAVSRLRQEIGRSKESLLKQERELAEKTTAVPGVMTFSLGVGVNGDVLLDGGPFDADRLRQRLSTLEKGSKVDFRLRASGAGGNDRATLERMQATIKAVSAVVRELGLGAKFQAEDLEKK